jgi:hypothetical protein
LFCRTSFIYQIGYRIASDLIRRLLTSLGKSITKYKQEGDTERIQLDTETDLRSGTGRRFAVQIVRPEQDDGSDMKVADKEFSPRDIGNVIVLVAALGSLVWYQYPLKSSRPDATELEKNITQHDHGARARLWRDPFAAVEDYRRKFNIQHEQEPLGHWWPDLIDQGKKHVGKELILLPVLVNGAPEQEEVENRIRTRVAVVSALGIAGYEPLDGDHIGYVLKPYKHSEYMPFEWYVRSGVNGPGSSALVLWINDDGIDSPLVPIAESYEQLKPLFAKIYSDVSTITKVIGPSSSNGLRAIVETVSKPKQNREIDILNGLEIFSARAPLMMLSCFHT